MPKTTEFPYQADEVENALSYVGQHGFGVQVDFDDMIKAAAHQWYAEQQRRMTFANVPDAVEDLREFY